MKILLLGGSKSGKSMLAQRLVKSISDEDGSKPYYWATMEPTDGEDRTRIKRHLEERAGWGFETIECAKNIASSLPAVGKSAAVLFDSITALTANEMFGTAKSGYLEIPDKTAQERTAEELSELMNTAKHTVLVCDELFRDGAVYDELTEGYRRTLANICRKLAENCDAVCEVVCGNIKLHKGELPFFDGRNT
ncbi:MAG: bifunctional adenosylcobinamide kinase/adenosylcobinamide-phosphate guanylyltransferase [Clostridia bacterium]|nr:bifunctional adenosylcobinamide kinase/adenosylcobinamide-phosphate guanylyltransferase [Clostridia bacterium]